MVDAWVDGASVYPLCSMKKISRVLELQKNSSVLTLSLPQFVCDEASRNNHGSIFLTYSVPTVPSTLHRIYDPL